MATLSSVVLGYSSSTLKTVGATIIEDSTPALYKGRWASKRKIDQSSVTGI